MPERILCPDVFLSDERIKAGTAGTIIETAACVLNDFIV
jgi:hypothetical protein